MCVNINTCRTMYVIELHQSQFFLHDTYSPWQFSSFTNAKYYPSTNRQVIASVNRVTAKANILKWNMY